jgi:hypothetical protein
LDGYSSSIIVHPPVLDKSTKTAEDNKGQQESKPVNNEGLTTTRKQVDSSSKKPVKVPTDVSGGTGSGKTKSFHGFLKGCLFTGVAYSA